MFFFYFCQMLLLIFFYYKKPSTLSFSGGPRGDPVRRGGDGGPPFRHHPSSLHLEPRPLHRAPPAHRGPAAEQIRDVSSSAEYKTRKGSFH